MRFLDTMRSLDWPMLGASILLVLVGLSMLMSETYSQGLLSDLFLRQSFAMGIGLVLCALAAKIPYHSWRRYAFIVYTAGIIGLVVVAYGARVIRGTMSRLELIGFQIQPSELVKIAIIVVLAWYLHKYREMRMRQVVVSGLFIFVPVALIIQEPDAGTAVLLLATWLGVVFFLGLPWKSIILLVLIGVLCTAAAWQWVFLDYQKDRILTFLHPAGDPLRTGYSITQSIIAVGSGQFLGRGLGHGPQSQLKFLPERHTDFIFSSIGEELGFVGVMVVTSLYSLVLWRLFVITKSTRDSFGQLLGMGVFLIMLMSFVISAGMNVGLLPVTGIPLPFVSYGGSNLVVTFILIGIAQSVRIYSRFTQASPMEVQGII